MVLVLLMLFIALTSVVCAPDAVDFIEQHLALEKSLLLLLLHELRLLLLLLPMQELSICQRPSAVVGRSESSSELQLHILQQHLVPRLLPPRIFGI
jgi:hypothetical protein